MPLRNRVTPLGEIVAVPDRGTMMGNRGVLHDESRRLVRCWEKKSWICCLIEFRGRRREPLMAPGLYTELFFLDEAVALAAGHRPCGTCRWEQFEQFRSLATKAWCADKPPKSGEVDQALHAERINARPGEHKTHRQCRRDGRFEDLADGAFVLLDEGAWLVRGERLLRYTPAGYDAAMPRPDGPATVLTPPSILKVLETGYTPCLHPSAERGMDRLIGPGA